MSSQPHVSNSTQFQRLTLAATVSPTTSTATTLQARHHQLFTEDTSGRISQNVQTTRSRATHSTCTQDQEQLDQHGQRHQHKYSMPFVSKQVSRHVLQHRISLIQTRSSASTFILDHYKQATNIPSISALCTQTELQGTQANNLSCDYTSRHSTNSIINNTSTHRRLKPGHRFNSTNSCQDSVRQRSSLKYSLNI